MAVVMATIGVLISRNMLSIAFIIPLVGLVWRKHRQFKRLEVFLKLERLEWPKVSTDGINWCEVSKLAQKSKDERWRMLTVEELLAAMWFYPARFRKMSYWTVEGLTVSFPERKVLKENPVQSAGLYFVRVRR